MYNIITRLSIHAITLSIYEYRKFKFPSFSRPFYECSLNDNNNNNNNNQAHEVERPFYTWMYDDRFYYFNDFYKIRNCFFPFHIPTKALILYCI